MRNLPLDDPDPVHIAVAQSLALRRRRLDAPMSLIYRLARDSATFDSWHALMTAHPTSRAQSTTNPTRSHVD